eukprot:3668416-Rhodomonas_salina.1
MLIPSPPSLSHSALLRPPLPLALACSLAACCPLLILFLLCPLALSALCPSAKAGSKPISLSLPPSPVVYSPGGAGGEETEESISMSEDASFLSSSLATPMVSLPLSLARLLSLSLLLSSLSLLSLFSRSLLSCALARVLACSRVLATRFLDLLTR